MTRCEDLEPILALALEAARQAGDIIQRPATDAWVRQKERRGLVTAVDLAAQEAIVRVIREAFPHHAVLGEEGQQEQGAADAEHLWVVDPLDGTTNFVHGVPQYCVSIAYAEQGQVLAGVVLDPVRDETFTAVRGGGASVNGRPIRVSNRAGLDQALVATGFYYERGRLMEQTLTTIRHLFALDIHGIRRFGSAALDLCWVACGRYDAFFELFLSPWDFAAGSLLVHEAGGYCESISGGSVALQGGGIIAANRLLFERFAQVVRET